jgi:hypothetical protein
VAFNKATRAEKLPHDYEQLSRGLSQSRHADARPRRPRPQPCRCISDSLLGMPPRKRRARRFGSPGSPAASGPAFTDGGSCPVVRRCRLVGAMEGITCIVLNT